MATRLSQAAERLAAARGHQRISLSVGIGNAAARRLYGRLGYGEAGLEPERVEGTIVIRGEDVDGDDTLLYLVKDIGTAQEATSRCQAPRRRLSRNSDGFQDRAEPSG